MKAVAAHPHEKPHHPHRLLQGLLFAFVFALGLGSAHDPATWIRVKLGARVLSEGTLPRVEPFSYGAAGAAWTTHSWLTDVLLAKLDALGGAGLVVALKSAVIAGGFALLLPINHGSALAAASLLSLGACAAWAGMTEGPGAFDFLFFALLVRLLRPRSRFRWTTGAAGAALTALWVNLHGAAAPLALWLLGLKAFKASLRTAAGERVGYWAMLLAGALFFSWNPHGYGVLAHAFADAAPGASYWETPLVSLYGALLIAGLASCAFTLQQEFVTTLACATVLALSIALPGLRPLAALAACPVTALGLGHLLAQRRQTRERVLRWGAPAAALLAAYYFSVTRPLASAGGYGAPALSGAVHFLDAGGVRGRMFNEPAVGAELIGLTDRPVFADSRQGLYQESFRREAEDWPRLFKSLDAVYRFDYAVVRNRRAGAPARILDENPEWRLGYADDRALVYLKLSGADGWLAARAPFRLVAPNRLWPDGLDAALSKPREAAAVLEEIDRWALSAPDSSQALLWKAYALDRLKMADQADRLLALVLGRPALDWDAQLQAVAAFVLEARGRTQEAKLRYRRAEKGARRLGEEALAAEARGRLRRLETPAAAR